MVNESRLGAAATVVVGLVGVGTRIGRNVDKGGEGWGMNDE